MIKYLIIIIAGIVLIWLSIVVVRSLDPQREPQETDDEFVTAIQNRPMNPGGSVEPEMVTVMLDDSVYHKPDCGWIGSNSKKMTVTKAVNLGFAPCLYCFGEE